MSCMLIKELQKIDEKLKSLRPEEVVDCSDLNKEKADSLCRYYGNEYNVVGPYEDKKNPGKYIIAFLLKPGRVQNA